MKSESEQLQNVAGGMRSSGEGERTILGLEFWIIVVGIGGGEVETSASLKGGEESGDDGGANPRGHLIEPHSRNHAHAAAVSVIHRCRSMKSLSSAQIGVGENQNAKDECLTGLRRD